MPRLFRMLTDYRGLDGGVVLPPNPSPDDFGTSILNWIGQPGGQVLTVIPRTYSAGRITAAPHTTALYGSTCGGNLVLWADPDDDPCVVDMAPPPGWTTADTNTYDLEMVGTTEGVIFAGNWEFINGTVRAKKRCTFWGTDHTFDYLTWAAENGHHSSPGWSTVAQYHDAPRTFDFAGPGYQDLSLYRVNIHDTGTGVIYRPDAQDLVVVGTKFTTLSDGGPTYDPPDANGRDLIHPTCISCVAGVAGLTLTDSLLYPGSGVSNGYTAAGLNLSNDASHSATDITVSRLWVRDTQYNIVLNSEIPHFPVTADFTDVYTWNGIGFGSDSDWIESYTDNNPTAGTSHAGGLGFGAAYITTNRSNVNIHVAGTGTDPATAWQNTAGHGNTLADLVAFFTANGWP